MAKPKHRKSKANFVRRSETLIYLFGLGLACDSFDRSNTQAAKQPETIQSRFQDELLFTNLRAVHSLMTLFKPPAVKQ
uniref:Uncharacterized protein n=1 Tax=Candidozyma auris TaxID=498019 RepID=A0A0L0NPV5_CANAR